MFKVLTLLFFMAIGQLECNATFAHLAADHLTASEEGEEEGQAPLEEEEGESEFA